MIKAGTFYLLSGRVSYKDARNDLRNSIRTRPEIIVRAPESLEAWRTRSLLPFLKKDERGMICPI
ncbi:MAG: hypothetical protein C0490_03095 [Marivirga sp.]|nr:hypothetical protein [Marivirga sp.]